MGYIKKFYELKQLEILEPSFYAKKTGKIKISGELYWTKKEMQYFSETYYRIPYFIVDKSLLKSKMIDYYNYFNEYDSKGYPIWKYTKSPKIPKNQNNLYLFYRNQ